MRPLKRPWRGRLALALGLTGFLCLVITGMLFASLSLWPGFGAQAADWLRQAFGDEAVARLETVVFQAQDALRNQGYRLRGEQPAAPWTAIPMPEPSSMARFSPTLRSSPQPVASPADHPTQAHRATASTQTASPVASPTPGVWTLPQVAPLGKLSGEGQWSSYIQDPTGRVVAYRTYLQPDPKRPFTVAAVVAMDLANTRLHFLLGSQEPKSPVETDRSGRIPVEDLKPGVLLAVFNGGFKANQGHFGVMVDRVTVIPPRPGLGVIAIYAGGQVRMGAWGTEISSTPDMLAWRQNGPLIVQDGQVNPRTAELDPESWGYAVGGSTATWRSGIGLSADGRTLLYAAAPDIALPALASALQAAGADQALQMDINDYWVHFDAILSTDTGLLAQGLLDEMQRLDDQRYLKSSIRDFFYLMAAP